jgi:murein L,D-transpeptidase YcbB/YkuD
MEQRCNILGADPELTGVVGVEVPSIYGRKGDPLPKRMAKLVTAAAQSLQRVYGAVAAEGGHLLLSDAFRSAEEQQRAHHDYVTGKKSAFSPPSCNSVHEAGRAIDIDAYDTGIGHARVRAILNEHGWVHIVETLTGNESWHYEFREARWEEFKEAHGYAAMARAMKQEIGNTVGLEIAEEKKAEVRRLQELLRLVDGAKLAPDGIYGVRTRRAVKAFQRKHGLQVDGVAGPITVRKLEEMASR